MCSKKEQILLIILFICAWKQIIEAQGKSYCIKQGILSPLFRVPVRIVETLSFLVSQLASSIYTHFNTLKKKDGFMKTLWEKVKLLNMSNFTFYHNVFDAICILKSFNSHISAVFKFGTVSKWCNRQWVKGDLSDLGTKI